VRYSVILLAILALSASTLATKERKSISVTAVTHDSQLVQRTSTYQTPGQSNTSCSDTSTTTGSTTNGTADCTTTTAAPQNHEITVSRLDVVDKVLGDGMIYTIVCSAHWKGSNCAPLIDGDMFEAEIKGTTIWISARKGGNQGKAVKVKYKILDIRPAPSAKP
jgi:hypothetical protein